MRSRKGGWGLGGGEGLGVVEGGTAERELVAPLRARSIKYARLLPSSRREGRKRK